MNRRGWTTAPLCALFVCTVSAAQVEPDDSDPIRQQAWVQERLQVERAALAALKSQQASVLDVIELIEKRARATERRAALLERELTALRRRHALAEQQEAAAAAWMKKQVEDLSPRLRAMYRTHRRSRLDVLLSSSDFVSLIWRTRALSTLLERDLAAVRDTKRAIAFQAESRRTLERLQASLTERARQLAFERELSLRQQDVLTQLLGQIAVDARESARLVRELVQAERRLARMVDAFESVVDDSAFAQLRGALPWPTHGIIEVGFGQVVNPRFNTVTFQKGVDIRARAGQPVLAVAPGKVVYAAWLKGYGNVLIMDHGSGYHTVFAHLASFARAVGDEVHANEVIGHVGDTGSLKGPYLYFEIRKNGIAIDPVDWLGPPDL